MILDSTKVIGIYKLYLNCKYQ